MNKTLKLLNKFLYAQKCPCWENGYGNPRILFVSCEIMFSKSKFEYSKISNSKHSYYFDEILEDYENILIESIK